METIISKPLSYLEFLKETSMQDGPEAIAMHSDTLYQFRLARAAELGISLEDLHDRRQTPPERE